VAAGHGGSLRTKKLFSLTDSILDPLTLTQSRFDSFAIQPSDTHNDEGATIGGVTQVKPVDRADAGIGRTPAGGSSAFTASSETDLEFKAAAPSADELIRNAHTCLLHRDWECAAARYRQILKEYGNRSESVSALIGLARIELHYLNKPTQALAHFSTYEKRYPDGALTEEALLGIAESLRLLGRPEEEKASLRAFIERYPKSASIEKAKSRLKESAE
jgi:TolA-binding protein